MDALKAMELIHSYLPPEKQIQIRQKALKERALGALRQARGLLAHGETQAGKAQIKAAFYCSHHPHVWLYMLYVLLGTLAHKTGLHRFR